MSTLVFVCVFGMLGIAMVHQLQVDRRVSYDQHCLKKVSCGPMAIHVAGPSWSRFRRLAQARRAVGAVGSSCSVHCVVATC